MLMQILNIASGALALIILILGAIHSSKLSGIQADLQEVKDLIDGLDKAASPPSA